MAKKWLPTNFCPRDCNCSMDDALHPTNGHAIQSIETPSPDQAPFPSEIRGFTGDPNHDPYVGQFQWMPTKGQIVDIVTYTQLFSLMGTAYGGNGRTTFGLPNVASNGSTTYYICMDGEIPGFVGP